MQQEAKHKSEQQESATGRAADPGVRMIVVSWMVEVAEEFRLQQETLHMAVLLLDRFMANSEVTIRSPHRTHHATTSPCQLISNIAPRVLGQHDRTRCFGPADAVLAMLSAGSWCCYLQDVPRCVLQLLAVGCVLLASKELEVSCCASAVQQLAWC